jgi:hypothetical protein
MPAVDTTAAQLPHMAQLQGHMQARIPQVMPVSQFWQVMQKQVRGPAAAPAPPSQASATAKSVAQMPGLHARGSAPTHPGVASALADVACSPQQQQLGSSMDDLLATQLAAEVMTPNHAERMADVQIVSRPAVQQQQQQQQQSSKQTAGSLAQHTAAAGPSGAGPGGSPSSQCGRKSSQDGAGIVDDVAAMLAGLASSDDDDSMDSEARLMEVVDPGRRATALSSAAAATSMKSPAR